MTPDDGKATRGPDARDGGAGESTDILKLMGERDTSTSALAVEASEVEDDDKVLIVDDE